MNPEEQIVFVAETLDAINRMQELLSDQCRALAEEIESSRREKISQHDDIPF